MVDHLAEQKDITAWVKKSKTITSVSKLPGDASTRGYYRVFAKDTSYVVMKTDPFSDVGMNLNFLVVQKHLALSGVDVPAVLDVDPTRGFVLLEDLGDVTLLRRLQDVSSPDVERAIYERVLDELVKLQINGAPERAHAQIPAFSLKFDHEKLMWEMGFMIEHFYQKHLGREIKAGDRKVMNDGLSGICTILAAQPMVLAHRDFHCRNIMVTPGKKKERLVMIDFQDARMGPAQYDLVSLLRDSYYQLDEVQIVRLIEYYTARWKALTGKEVDRAAFQRAFDLMAVQRNLKAIGSFASFLNRRGNPGYLKFIGNTFENVRKTLLKYPEYSALREVLFHYYYF